VELSHRDYDRETPVADEVFRAYLNQFSYDPTPLEARVDRTSASADWRHEKVVFAAAYGGEQVIARLFVPTAGRPPYQTVVYYPGSNAIVERSSDAFVASGPFSAAVDFLTRSGRAVVLPVYKGSLERNDGLTSTWASPTHRHAEYLVRQVKDFRRTVDDLETRPEFDVGKLAYFGNSWGGGWRRSCPRSTVGSG
jgi:eukaryotic-like serine/threonine-protein kinase